MLRILRVLPGALLALLLFPMSAQAELVVTPIPWVATNPEIPHIVPNGRVTTLKAIAEALSLEVVAEGIETEIQKRKLQELNCHRGQGYLMARPSPLDELPLD